MDKIKKVIISFIFAALIAFGATVSMDIGVVSFTLQTLFIFIAGLTLPVPYALLSVILYICAGIIGLPVFSGGNSGIETLTGPTGGFIVGFAIAVAAVAHLSRDIQYKVTNASFKRLYGLSILYSFIGSIIIQIFGSAWGKIYSGNSWTQIYFDYVHPFYFNLSAKAILAGIIAVEIWRFTKILKQNPNDPSA